MRASLVTISYMGDLALAQELCTSVDRYADPAIEHVVVVPRAELAAFQPMANSRRRILSKEEVLPERYRKLPLPYKIDLRPIYYKLLREIWWGPTGIVRGWIVQQILKLSAPSFCDSDLVIFADSDIALIRPTRVEHFLIGDQTRLFRAPGETADSAMHQEWHRVSARLLGMPEQEYFGADYIGHLVSWSRDNILALQSRLEQIGGRRWDQVIAKQRAFSEYVLYGIFAEHVLGAASRQTPSSEKIVHASWHYPIRTPEGQRRFIDGLEPQHVGVAIQSTDGFSVDERRAMIDKMRKS